MNNPAQKCYVSPLASLTGQITYDGTSVSFFMVRIACVEGARKGRRKSGNRSRAKACHTGCDKEKNCAKKHRTLGTPSEQCIFRL